MPDSESSKADAAQGQLNATESTNDSIPPKLSKDSPWCPVYDPESKSYYFWNTETQETTWDHPENGNITGTDDNRNTLEGATANTSANQSNQAATDYHQTYQEQAGQLQQGAQYADYQISAHFNAKSGKFESDPLNRNPSNHTYAVKAVKHMHHYFDYDTWAEERGTKYMKGEDDEAEKKKKPTKKELERWKKRAKEKQKQKRAWLYD